MNFSKFCISPVADWKHLWHVWPVSCLLTLAYALSNAGFLSTSNAASLCWCHSALSILLHEGWEMWHKLSAEVVTTSGYICGEVHIRYGTNFTQKQIVRCLVNCELSSILSLCHCDFSTCFCSPFFLTILHLCLWCLDFMIMTLDWLNGSARLNLIVCTLTMTLHSHVHVQVSLYFLSRFRSIIMNLYILTWFCYSCSPRINLSGQVAVAPQI